MGINYLVNFILGTIIQWSAVLIAGLILGFYYDYRLTLINCCFVPFIIASDIIKKGKVEGQGQKAVEANIESSILSECVVNTKTIFSFNFQKEAVSMYLQAIEFIHLEICKDSLITGLFIGLGCFCDFAANAPFMLQPKNLF